MGCGRIGIWPILTTTICRERRQSAGRFLCWAGVAFRAVINRAVSGLYSVQNARHEAVDSLARNREQSRPFAAQTSAGDPSQRWTRRGDSTLSDLIDRALQNNTGVGTAQSRRRHLRSERNCAAANSRLTITVSALNSGTKANTPGSSGRS